MECCICLKELCDQSTTLECKHKFHTLCIDKLHKKSCPLCRSPIVHEKLFDYKAYCIIL